MSDETENDGTANQDDIDNMFDGDSGGASTQAGMDLDEIDEPAELQEQNQGPEFEIGQPMAGDVTAIYDIPVRVSAVLGSSTMQVSQLLKLGRGAVVELDRKVGEAIDIYVNNRLVARGEVVVVEDKLGITMTEIVKSEKS